MLLKERKEVETGMKRNRIMTSICCLLFLCLNLLFPANTALAAQNTGGGSALVCLLDASGSMRSNDGNRLAIDSVSRLIYSLPSDCKAGVVAYNNGTAFQSELIGEQGRSGLVDTVSKIEYSGYTDAGKGLHDAVELLKNDNSSKKTIIILSDGGIEGRTPEETEQSKEEFESSLAEAAALKITIYVMGLGNEMKDMSNEIYTAGTATGGSVVRIESDKQIAAAIDKISRDSGTVARDATYTIDAGEAENTLTIPFDYKGATEARIVLSSNKSFEVLSVDAGGSEATQHKGELFTVIQIKNPPVGSIAIRIRGQEGNPVRADVAPEYGSSGQTAPSKEETAKEEAPKEETVKEEAPKEADEVAHVPAVPDSGRKDKGTGMDLPGMMEALKSNGITAIAVIAAVFITAAVMIGIVLVILMKKEKSRKVPEVIKINIRGGRFGKKGYSLRYSLFRLLQQGEITLSEVLASGGVEETAAGSEKIYFEMENNGCPVLVNDSDFEVRYRRRRVAGGTREKLPLLSAVKIFVETADSGLTVKRLVIE